MTTYEFNNNLIGMKTNLQRFAMSLTYDRDTALDLVQDTYLKALTFKDKFVDYTNLKAWVFTIMKNTFINNYRRCLLYTSDAADDLLCVDLGGRRIIKKKKTSYERPNKNH